MENASRNACKPFADIEVATCLACGAQKRFPIGAIRQSRKANRNEMNVHDLPRSEKQLEG